MAEQAEARIAELLEQWQLTPDGDPWRGTQAHLVPVRTDGGVRSVLKVGSAKSTVVQRQSAVLQAWQGRGAVQVLRADPARSALLLERLEQADLSDFWDEQACEIVAGLYRRLHVPAMPQLPSMHQRVRGWTAQLRAAGRAVPMPPRLVEQALGLAADLAAEPEPVVLHGALGYTHVLVRPAAVTDASDGDVWVAIAPQPANGDPCFEVLPMLSERFAEYGEVGSVRDGVRRRFHTLIDTAELDEDRARDWVIVRSVLAAHRVHQIAVAHERKVTPSEKGFITQCITVAKAVQE